MFDAEITKYRKLQAEIQKFEKQKSVTWLQINLTPINQALESWIAQWVMRYMNHVTDDSLQKLSDLQVFMVAANAGLVEEVADSDKEALMRAMGHVRDVRVVKTEIESMFQPLHSAISLLKKHAVNIEELLVSDKTPILEYLEAAPQAWRATHRRMLDKKESITAQQNEEADKVKVELDEFFIRIRSFRGEFRKDAPFSHEGPSDEAYDKINAFMVQLKGLEKEIAEFAELEELFELPAKSYPEASETLQEMRQLKELWDFHAYTDSTYAEWREQLWNDIDTEALSSDNKKLMKALRKFTNTNQIVKGWTAYTNLEAKVRAMDTTLPLVEELHSKAMRDRHWTNLAIVCESDTPIDVTDPTFSLNSLIELGAQDHADDIEEIIEIANKELKIARKLKDIKAVWDKLELVYRQHKDTEIKLVSITDDIVEALEDNQLELQTMIGMGKFVDHFRSEVESWQKKLGDVESVLKVWTSVTRQWASLETIFLGSADIRAQLPEDTKRFEGLDSEFKDLMKTTEVVPNVIEACCQEGREDSLNQMASNLELCQRALNEYLDMKKKIFPRFYFVSNVALLDMLSNGNNPPRIMKHLGSCYDALSNLSFEEGSSNTAHSMVAKDSEVVEFANGNFVITGAVEDWLNALTAHMNECIRTIVDHAYGTAAEWEVGVPRHEWLYNYPAQVVLSVASCVSWSEETEAALEEYLGGNEDSVKQYLELCNSRLAALIMLVRGKLEKMTRRKIIATITLDVHGRDVVKGLIAEKTEGPESFAWQRQLRFYWDKENRDIQIRICDWRTMYTYEYIGNTGRLVITPLTDRCYITLSTALRLMLSGAPAGPAGTGKTETVKDMGRAVALCVYVFNCSPQMNYRGLADIFKGLAQSGSWGCFDEFNRISIDVLSVVATQVKCVQDAIVQFAVPANREPQYQGLPPGQPPYCIGNFTMLDDELRLVPTCGIFITMNPGYAGRTELPENLKTLFRSCAMIRPDLAPICENMLMSEGYQEALLLSVKFTTLYGLCKALLSPQHHYDWGLRAIKSVLVVAGKLLRSNPELDEECVLMRALRDFNTPKIPGHDMPIFMRLIEDLFPAYAKNTPPVIDADLRSIAAKVAVENGLQPDDELLIKVVQFQELLDVRHSVMLLGPAGCGKTTIWKTLLGCHNYGKEKRVAVAEVINPKAVFNEELFGYMTLAKDWKDGCLSIVMRGMSFNDRDLGFYDWQTTKWMVLDDDVDTLWIESMNTVMDANKMLTLVSNERIPLTNAMRMVFEIDSIDNGSPATVSRAGMLYINETDIGWRPYVDSWIQRLPDASAEAQKRLGRLFDKYMVSIMENTRKGLKKVVPVRVLSQAMVVCSMLQFLLTQNIDNISDLSLESTFVYCLVWAFGCCLATPEVKTAFDNMFTSTYPDIKFPKEGEIFDYYFDVDEEDWKPWADKVAPYEAEGTIGEDMQFFDIVVPTLESTRTSAVFGGLVGVKQPVMFVGGAGTGKTTMINEFFSRNAPDRFMKALISMNYFTDSASFQQQLEGPIDKRSGKIYGPPTGKTLVYFVDDLNLPYIEDYGTQNSLSLFRQSQDYNSYFDRENLGLKKEVVDTQYVAAMNPTAGSFTITGRLQRHFATFMIPMPASSDQRAIYGSILSAHMESFDSSVSNLLEPILDMVLDLHQTIVVRFLPSAIKFVYNWNLRELDQVFGGMCRMIPDHYTDSTSVLRLLVHEINRTFKDRLNDFPDISKFEGVLSSCFDKAFKDVKVKKEDVFAEPLIFTDFHKQPGGVPTYLGVGSAEGIQEILDGKLEEYNESNTIMDLVLFRDAIAHVCRIARIIAQPRGNALLIGVGGSGKQSLSRLATFICGYEVRQLNVSSRYGVEEFKEELRQMYILAGQKGVGIVFLLTDSHIVDEKFLIYVNDLLSNGFIPDLFAPEDLDGLVSSVRNLAKQAGVPDTPETLLKFFIDRVRSLLHVVLCFSPVGDVFRIRARRFPGLVNCTSADRFFGWPEDALQSVGRRFLEEVELPSDDLRGAIADHMAMVHLSVKEKSELYRKRSKRNNYVTPKSFLELVDFYKLLLADKRAKVEKLVDRLDTGLATLAKTEKDVAELQVDLTHTMAKVKEKVEATDALMITMAASREEAEAQQEIAGVEKEKATIAAAGAAKIEAEAKEELDEAKPAMDAAAAAVDVLNGAAITELRGFKQPPNGVDKVMICVQMMYAGEFSKKKHTWPNQQKLMKNVGQFLEGLKSYNAEEMDEKLINALEPLVNDPVMEYKTMLGKSFAAANLASWAVNCYRYNRIYVKVKPLMDSLNAARATKAAAETSLANALATVAGVEAKLAELEAGYKQAVQEKQEVEEQAERCLAKLGLAKRLIGGLASEGTRWGSEIEVLRFNLSLLVGNVLLSSAFVSYIGAFNADFRNQLWKDTWCTDIVERGIPLIEGVDPLGELTDEARNAKMYSNGLPADRISTENGSIISQCKRWPLLIDPQLQGIKWLRKRESNRGEGAPPPLILQMSMSNWPRQLEGAIQNGRTVIIENLGEDVDATLDPVLARAIYRKGRAYYLKFGGEEIEFDMGFKLYLQTKLANPHYKPEIAATCTLVNFTSTEVGLEDQLLARVVNVERPDLEAQKQELQAAFNNYKIQLFTLEEDLLERLANAPEDILSDVALIEGLEATKAASTEIGIAVAKGKETEIVINDLREKYRPVAAEASMLYFMLTELCNVDYFYQYSLDAYVFFFYKAIDRAEKNENLPERLANLIKTLRFTIFTWVARGLFEKDKMIFLAQLTFKLMQRQSIQCGDEPGLDATVLQFLLMGPKKVTETNPISWLPNSLWYTANALSEVSGFEKFTSDLQEATPRFREWYNQLTPEREKLPLDWSRLDKDLFKKMLVVRTLRPDRMTMSMSYFVENTLPDGKSYTEADQAISSTQILGQSLLDASPEVPIFFILSPGVNVVEYVDKCAIDPLYNKVKQQDYHNISMGQGQDVLAMQRLEVAHKQGHWVILNNIHLMPKWCVELEKKFDAFNMAGNHPDMRVFLTAEPSKTLPIGILSRSIKLTNEPPSGLKANLMRSVSSFKAEDFDDNEPKTRAILFGLSHFHAILMERKKFGPMGFNMQYPFGLGDLRDAAICLLNYMESAPSKIPWADLQYIFGQIIWGGHIVNDNDRLLSMTYQRYYMVDALLDDHELFPFCEGANVSFRSPLPTTHAGYVKHVEQNIPGDTPLAFGLHPNAEIGYRTTASQLMFDTLISLQSGGGGAEDGALTPTEIAAAKMEDVQGKLDDWDLTNAADDVQTAIDEVGPFENVFLQETTTMGLLIDEMKRSLKELGRGFAGELTMSGSMEALENALFLGRVPAAWTKLAWPSMRTLDLWIADMLKRCTQLMEWTENPNEVPRVTWISGLIIPESFLTAIKQVTAQAKGLELDKLVTWTEWTKKMNAEKIEGQPRSGVYLSGYYMQGARFDTASLVMAESRPKELFSTMPIVTCSAILSTEEETNGVFSAPVYKTEFRGPTFVFSAQIRTKHPNAKWVLAGVALVQDVGE
jgi:dynein heavy chain